MALPPLIQDRITPTDLARVLPNTPLYQGDTEKRQAGVGWLLSPQPYLLTSAQQHCLQQLGPCLHRFNRAVDRLYRTSLKTPALSWVQALLEAGKTQDLVKFSQMNRFKQHMPWVIRPDLLVTPTGFALCEIDAVPGGIGFTAALQQAYRSLGFSLAGDDQGMPQQFLRLLLQAAPPGIEAPTIAVVVSDEASDYRLELSWLVDEIRPFYPHIALLHPRQIALERNQLGYLDDQDKFIPIHIVYRFFELFDLPNIPQIELIQYAVKKGLVFCTPPFKPYLEEKLVLALLHYPILEPFWQVTLGESDFALLKSLVPESWILDPAPIPPHAQILPELRFQDETFHEYTDLGRLSQKQRELVIKPSGFSPLAWGSRGVVVGHDVPQDAWQQTLSSALTALPTAPHLMQRYAHTVVEPYAYFHPQTGTVVEAAGRTRICPYYFVIDDQPVWVGTLVTTCPKDKKVIHGMQDGVMRPAAPSSSI